MAELSQAVPSALRGILGPAQAEVEKIDAEIAELEGKIESLRSEIGAKREERRVYERVMRAADPTRPGPGRKGPQPQVRSEGASEIAVKQVLDYLQDHPDRYRNGAGFYSVGLWRERNDEGLATPSDATINKALRVLHERGQIRLVKANGGNNGRTRIYRLV